jgi:hypothetical protein
MATPAQVLANQTNAKHSTGPNTPQGKTRASQNATTLGLFSASAFIHPDEHEIYVAFRASWTARLVPDGPIEEALVAELIQAAWRLRRCGLLETSTPETTETEDLDRMQASIDRARATSQRALQRNMDELRRIQTDRHMRDALPYGHSAHANFGAASTKEIENFYDDIKKRYDPAAFKTSPVIRRWEDAKRSQSTPTSKPETAERTQSVARNAACPCNSGEKYKRCCGKDAPPVLSRAA